jgi:prevent-host-death family protein
MSGTASVHEAKTHLSRLLQRVESAGESIVITRSGKPVARLVPVGGEPRRPGRLKGRIRIGKDFDAPLPAALLGAFRGEEP